MPGLGVVVGVEESVVRELKRGEVAGFRSSDVNLGREKELKDCSELSASKCKKFLIQPINLAVTSVSE